MLALRVPLRAPASNVLGRQVGDRIPWVRYSNPVVKNYKLNAERNNGRAAMLGITGCMLHEVVGVDALYPTGGLSGAPPPPIF